MSQHPHCCSHDTAHSQLPSQDNAPAGAKVFRIPSMDCASEESEIRHAVANIAGIRSLNFQLAKRTLAIDASDDTLQQALVAIRAAGFDPQLVNGDEPSVKHTSIFNNDLWRPMIALIIAVGIEILAVFVPATLPFKLLSIVLAATSIALSGFSTYGKGLAALRRGRLNINALMSVAVTGASLIGQWPEAAMVMALYAIAELIEARSVDRARNAIKGLLDMTPDTAEVQLPDGSWQTVLVTTVALDSIVRVKPGGRVPLDGVVTAGASVINQAPVTGESIPVDKTINDIVFAGTINETSILEFRVTAVASNSTLSRIIHAVEQAQGLAFAWRDKTPGNQILFYLLAQFGGALIGVWIAHFMFAMPIWEMSIKDRSGIHFIGSEFIATFGLLAIILTGDKLKTETVSYAVAAYIVGAYWFTSSTSFANPAVTLARAFTDSFSGIRLADVPWFLLSQVVALLVTTTLFGWLLSNSTD